MELPSLYSLHGVTLSISITSSHLFCFPHNLFLPSLFFIAPENQRLYLILESRYLLNLQEVDLLKLSNCHDEITL